MGSDNRAMWKAFGVGFADINGVMVCSIQHPVRPMEKLWVMPDSIHLFKNILPCLNNNKVIRLPEDIVLEEGLATDEVKLEHLDSLLDFEKDHELKVAFRLQEDILHCRNQYNKMKVSSPRSVFNKRTAVALRAKAEKEGDPSINTTAFFVELVSRWFDLVSNRGGKLALRLAKMEEYRAALKHLERTADIFRRMKVGSDAKWKPVQTGMMMACAGLLQVQEYLLVDRHFIFVLLGLITQDCLENLNSLVRYMQPTPNALHFKQNLKVITLTQMCLTASNTNYLIDSTEDPCEVTLDFLTYTKQVAAAKKNEEEVNILMESAALHVPQITDCQANTHIDPWEMYVIYDMAGSVLSSVKAMNIKTCEDCFSAVLWRGTGQHPYSVFVGMREYKRGCMISVSDECFKVILKAEVTFRMTRDVLKTVKHINAVEFLVEKLKYAWDGTSVPSCHDITSKILNRFFTKRFKIHGLQTRKKKKTKDSVRFSSKTMGMHAAVA